MVPVEPAAPVGRVRRRRGRVPVGDARARGTTRSPRPTPAWVRPSRARVRVPPASVATAPRARGATVREARVATVRPPRVVTVPVRRAVTVRPPRAVTVPVRRVATVRRVHRRVRRIPAVPVPPAPAVRARIRAACRLGPVARGPAR